MHLIGTSENACWKDEGFDGFEKTNQQKQTSRRNPSFVDRDFPLTGESVKDFTSASPVLDDAMKQCSICLETMHVADTIILHPCRHEFHGSCVTTWLSTPAPNSYSYSYSKTCPTCRGRLLFSSVALENSTLLSPLQPTLPSAVQNLDRGAKLLSPAGIGKPQEWFALIGCEQHGEERMEKEMEEFLWEMMLLSDKAFLRWSSKLRSGYEPVKRVFDWIYGEWRDCWRLGRALNTEGKGMLVAFGPTPQSSPGAVERLLAGDIGRVRRMELKELVEAGLPAFSA